MKLSVLAHLVALRAEPFWLLFSSTGTKHRSLKLYRVKRAGSRVRDWLDGVIRPVGWCKCGIDRNKPILRILCCKATSPYQTQQHRSSPCLIDCRAESCGRSVKFAVPTLVLSFGRIHMVDSWTPQPHGFASDETFDVLMPMSLSGRYRVSAVLLWKVPQPRFILLRQMCNTVDQMFLCKNPSDKTFELHWKTLQGFRWFVARVKC